MSVYRIGKHTFGDVIAKRVAKEKIGFLPIQHWRNSATNCTSYIQSPIPEKDIDFLAFCHELGHVKSKQPKQESASMFGMLSGWCNGRLECEYNAWIWGLKYFRRCGKVLTDELKNNVVECFSSYLNQAKDIDFAKKISEDFEKNCGMKVEVRGRAESTFSGFSMDWKTNFDFDKYKLPKEKEIPTFEKPKNWKPWHDLKQKQMKRSWKHCK